MYFSIFRRTDNVKVHKYPAWREMFDISEDYFRYLSLLPYSFSTLLLQNASDGQLIAAFVKSKMSRLIKCVSLKRGEVKGKRHQLAAQLWQGWISHHNGLCRVSSHSCRISSLLLFLYDGSGRNHRNLIAKAMPLRLIAGGVGCDDLSVQSSEEFVAQLQQTLG